jgi:amino acid transporter
LLALGAAIAATALIGAFVLGIVAWLYALVIAIAAIGIALLLGAYVNRSRPLLERGSGSPLA